MPSNAYKGQKNAIKRYQDKLERLTVWLTNDEKERVKALAEEQGYKNVSEYVKGKIL